MIPWAHETVQTPGLPAYGASCSHFHQLPPQLQHPARKEGTLQTLMAAVTVKMFGSSLARQPFVHLDGGQFQTRVLKSGDWSALEEWLFQRAAPLGKRSLCHGALQEIMVATCLSAPCGRQAGHDAGLGGAARP